MLHNNNYNIYNKARPQQGNLMQSIKFLLFEYKKTFFNYILFIFNFNVLIQKIFINKKIIKKKKKIN